MEKWEHQNIEHCLLDSVERNGRIGSNQLFIDISQKDIDWWNGNGKIRGGNRMTVAQ